MALSLPAREATGLSATSLQETRPASKGSNKSFRFMMVLIYVNKGIQASGSPEKSRIGQTAWIRLFRHAFNIYKYIHIFQKNKTNYQVFCRKNYHIQ